MKQNKKKTKQTTSHQHIHVCAYADKYSIIFEYSVVNNRNSIQTSRTL